MLPEVGRKLIVAANQTLSILSRRIDGEPFAHGSFCAIYVISAEARAQ
jgi:hypothetical protein